MAKLKEQQKPDAKPKRAFKKGSPSVSDSQNESEKLTCWQQDIKKLMGENFETLDQAVAAVVDAAISRQPEGANRDELVKFLTLLFESDPSLREELERVFGLPG